MADQSFEIQSCVPYLHVADVQTSISFYSLLGFGLDSRFGPEGDPYWARMRRPGCDLMLGKADGPIDPRQQAAMLYLHVDDVAALHAGLLGAGLEDGGEFTGRPCPFSKVGTVFAPTRPSYMPAGEVRVHDPDGYVLLVGQLGDPR
jgi:catechol 2,3-dioxygenase-like lactoylglutathione lyase family enzyme